MGEGIRVGVGGGEIVGRTVGMGEGSTPVGCLVGVREGMIYVGRAVLAVVDVAISVRMAVFVRVIDKMGVTAVVTTAGPAVLVGV